MTTAAAHLAVVDDEESIRQTVGLALRREGFEVATFDDGESAWEVFRERLPALVVLDILMPRMDGLELCRRLRSLSETLPILFLTSKDEEFDRVLGLELGADDYLCKPFSMRELVARVRVLLRRRALRRDPTTATKVLSAGDLMLDLDRFQATWKGAHLQLTVTEFRILHALARHPGRVKTREQLVEEGYPEDTYVSDRTVDTHIKRLRKKVEAADAAADPIETIYGLGYRWR
jgi:two-component system, OmpR family, response regulator ChvI